MIRITYKDLQEEVATWNEVHPSFPLHATAWSGYYRIVREDENTGAVLTVLVAEKTPRQTIEVFRAWKDGFYTHEKLVKEGVIK